MYNIPIYRGKKINSEEYIIGFLYDALMIYKSNMDTNPEMRLWIKTKDGEFEIEKSTLSIHYEDMKTLYEEPIFCSLTDGTGGTITETKDGKSIYKRVHMIDSEGMRISRDIEKIKSIKKYNGVIDIRVSGIY